MSEQELTPEQKQPAEAQAARYDELLGQVIQADKLEDRISAARELGLMPPADQPPQTRVVIRMVRTDDARLWGAIEGANGVVSQAIQEDPADMITLMAGAAQLACLPLMTDEEAAATKKRLAELAGA